jgi:transporter family protein
MPKWLLYSLLAVLSWGVWGLVSKVAADKVAPLPNQVLSTLGLIIPALAAFRAKHFVTGSSADLRHGLGFGFLSGLTGALGNLALFAALSHEGKASIVFPLTALYPLVTVAGAAVVLREKLHRVQAAGIALALVSIVVLNLVNEPIPSASAWKSATIVGWMAYALVALGLYGLTAIFQKLSTNHVPAEVSFVCFAAGFIPVAGVIIGTQSLQWTMSGAVSCWAILAGTLNGLGVLASLAAYRHGGKASIVTPLAALYPVITVALAVPLLHERVGLRELTGIACALAAGVVLSHEPARTQSGNAPTEVR